MRILTIIGTFVAVSALAFLGWFYWQSQHPHFPEGWPPGSVWVRPASLRMFRAGVWAGCRLDTQRNADTCKFANFKGKTWYEGNYSTCDGRAPIADDQL